MDGVGSPGCTPVYDHVSVRLHHQPESVGISAGAARPHHVGVGENDQVAVVLEEQIAQVTAAVGVAGLQ